MMGSLKGSLSTFNQSRKKAIESAKRQENKGKLFNIINIT